MYLQCAATLYALSHVILSTALRPEEWTHHRRNWPKATGHLEGQGMVDSQDFWLRIASLNKHHLF